MNLTDEKKAPLRAKDTDFKRHMLAMHARGSYKVRTNKRCLYNALGTQKQL